jgi:hypothetical protein
VISRGHCAQDEDQTEEEYDAHAERSRGVQPVSIGDSESICFFHDSLRSMWARREMRGAEVDASIAI